MVIWALKKAVRISFVISCFLCLLAGYSLTLNALEPSKAISQYYLSIWQRDRGFEQNSIFSIVQSNEGYIWLGTQNGLVRFDGIRFNVYNKSNTKQLLDNYIRALYVDRKGNLWIGTMEGGLSCLKNGSFTNYSPKDYPFLIKISSISEDHEGNIWFGTFYKGLARFKDNKFTQYTIKDGLPGNKIRALEQDKRGHLRIVSTNGIAVRSPAGKFVLPGYEWKTGSSTQYIISFCESKTNGVWVGTNEGLCRINGRKTTFYEIKDGLPNPKIKCLYEDRHHNLWGGTDGGGLFRIKNDKIEALTSYDGLTCQFIYSILEDREGSLWFGTLKGGLHQLRDTSATPFTTREGLSHNAVTRVLEDHKGNLFIATEGGGVNRLKDGEVTLKFTIKNGLLSNNVYSILEDSGGGFWVGSDRGLNCFKDGRVLTYSKKSGLLDDHVYRLMEDSRQIIWIISLNGLKHYHKGKFIRNPQEKIFTIKKRCILEDRNGSIWFGTFGNGLYRWDRKGNYTVYTTRDGLVNNEVESVFEDEDGILYIGTRGGLSLLADGKFTNYTTWNGLVDPKIHLILDDKKGNLWVAGQVGISCISKKELFDLAKGNVEAISPVLFNESDGLITPWCEEGTRTSDGKLWFTSEKGLIMIDPERIVKNTTPPPVVIEDFRVDLESMDFKSSSTPKQPRVIQIPPGKKRLDFYYTALSYIKPREVQFKLLLEGYDTNWFDAGDKRVATYTNLPSGEYTFKVVARNCDGVWNHTGASLSFYLKPYFYQTTWFYIAVVLFVFISILTGHRLRIRHLKIKEKTLQALVDSRTEELSNRTLQLETAHRHLQKSNKIIEIKNRSILDSIHYAGTIQEAILPTSERLADGIEDHLVFYKPRDIISGDFYWFKEKDGKFFIAAVDCTGHGVPGALLSMIGSITLNDIMNTAFIHDPAELLNLLNIGVRTALKQEKGNPRSRDGMELALCMIDLETKNITFAGAKRPLYYISGSELFEIKGDRKPIGGTIREKIKTFTNHNVEFDSDITLYLTTDGFCDQNNNEDKKYSSTRLKKFLLANSHLTMTEQEQALMDELKTFQGEEEQRDDITIIGVRLEKEKLGR